MKPRIDYHSQDQQMGDLLALRNVFIRSDFSYKERENLRQQLENYMRSDSCSPIKIDLKKFILEIQGADEASYLYRYVK